MLVNGKRVTKYNHNGEVYLEGREGSNYQIELVNRSSTQAEFVVSVDGLSIIDGKPAGSKSKGYIVPAYGSSVIDGWKVDSDTAATFKFGGKGKSYANTGAHGDVKNAGVIGLQVFRQYVSVPKIRSIPFDPIWQDVYQPYRATFGSPAYYDAPRGICATNHLSTSTTAAATQNLGAEYTSSIGTEFGDATDFKTTTVYFKRASNTPDTVKVFYYGDAKDLNRLGIVLDWQVEKAPKRPSAFPADSCPPPPGWRSK